MILNVFVPTVLWALAVANGLAFAQTQSGPALCVSAGVVVAFAAGSAYYARSIVSTLRDHVGMPARILVYGMALTGMAAEAAQLFPEGWLFGKEVVVVVPPPVTPPVPRVGSYEGGGPYIPAGPDRLATVPTNLVALVAEARKALDDKAINESECTGKGDGILKCSGDYLVAVTDVSGKIGYVTVYQGRPASEPGYDVTIGTGGGHASGVNPDIRVSHPPGMTVLAIKTAIDWAGTGRYVTYVPFNDELNAPEVRAAGIAYLWGQVIDAQDKLRAAGTKSQFFKGKLVADVIPADHVFSLVLTENVSNPAPFTASGSDADRLALLNEALTQLGTNQTNAWDYRHSSAGARGKGQIMPDTYAALCRAYKMACPAFEQGTLDDRLVIKLMFLHADDEWRGIRNRDWLVQQPSLMRQYLAAGYNGFYGNAATAIRTCGVLRWRDASCTHVVTVTKVDAKTKRKTKVQEVQTIVKDETRPYLDKYVWIRSDLFDATVHDTVNATVYPNAAALVEPEETQTETE